MANNRWMESGVDALKRRSLHAICGALRLHIGRILFIRVNDTVGFEAVRVPLLIGSLDDNWQIGQLAHHFLIVSFTSAGRKAFRSIVQQEKIGIGHVPRFDETTRCAVGSEQDHELRTCCNCEHMPLFSSLQSLLNRGISRCRDRRLHH